MISLLAFVLFGFGQVCIPILIESPSIVLQRGAARSNASENAISIRKLLEWLQFLSRMGKTLRFFIISRQITPSLSSILKENSSISQQRMCH